MCLSVATQNQQHQDKLFPRPSALPSHLGRQESIQVWVEGEDGMVRDSLQELVQRLHPRLHELLREAVDHALHHKLLGQRLERKEEEEER